MKKLEEGTIKRLQSYIAFKIKERGFDDEDLNERLLLFCEEVGELIKACRKKGIGHVKNSEVDREIGPEIADVLNMLFAVAVELGIDVEDDFIRKEEKIDRRFYERG